MIVMNAGTIQLQTTIKDEGKFSKIVLISLPYTQLRRNGIIIQGQKFILK